jgi:hypothetical protein
MSFSLKWLSFLVVNSLPRSECIFSASCKANNLDVATRESSNKNSIDMSKRGLLTHLPNLKWNVRKLLIDFVYLSTECGLLDSDLCTLIIMH